MHVGMCAIAMFTGAASSTQKGGPTIFFGQLTEDGLPVAPSPDKMGDWAECIAEEAAQRVEEDQSGKTEHYDMFTVNGSPERGQQAEEESPA